MGTARLELAFISSAMKSSPPAHVRRDTGKPAARPPAQSGLSLAGQRRIPYCFTAMKEPKIFDAAERTVEEQRVGCTYSWNMRTPVWEKATLCFSYDKQRDACGVARCDPHARPFRLGPERPRPAPARATNKRVLRGMAHSSRPQSARGDSDTPIIDPLCANSVYCDPAVLGILEMAFDGDDTYWQFATPTTPSRSARPGTDRTPRSARSTRSSAASRVGSASKGHAKPGAPWDGELASWSTRPS